MRGGRLRNRVTICRRPTGRDTYGGVPKVVSSQLVEVASVWGELKQAGSAEIKDGVDERGISLFDVTVRYTTGITTDMYIKHDDRVFEIVAPPINLYNKSAEMVIKCKEVFDVE